MKTTTMNEVDRLLGKVVGFTNEEGRREKPIWEMTKEIKVKIFDWKPIVEHLNKVSLTENFTTAEMEVRCGNGIIFIGEEKKPILIDNECCGIESERKNFFIDGKLFVATMIDGVGLFRKVEGGIAMFPSHFIDFDYDDIAKHFTGEEMELWQFMGERYEYNPRIHNNLRDIVKLYKGIEKR
jgi:hypothetical protein